MSGLRQVLLGFLAAFLSGLILIGALTLSLTERGQWSAPSPTQSLEATPTVSKTLAQKQHPTSTITPVPSDVFQPTEPTGGQATQAQPDDTPVDLADAYTATPTELDEVNKFSYHSLFPGVYREVPYVSSLVIIQDQPVEVTPTATEQALSKKSKSSKSCTKPHGWVAYTVRRGDTLSRLSQRTGASVAQIKKANCMGASNKLRAGKILFIPLAPIVPYMGPPMPLPSIYYYRPSRDPRPPQPTQPIVIITMPPQASNAAVPVTTEPPSINHASVGKLVYNATHF